MLKRDAANMRVLLVDDDELFADFVKHVFALIDLQITSVTSIDEARTIASGNPFDIVLLDSWLPDGKGIDLMAFLLELEIQPAVIMITADEDVANIKRSFELGVRDYMVKPIQTDLLLHKVTLLYQNILNERALAETNRQLHLAQEAAKEEEKLAQHVYSSLVGTSDGSVSGIYKYQLSHSDFCGDFLFSLKAENGNRYVFLADAMGHGLAAAICILPLISTAKAMANKNMPLLNIVHEINAKLEADLPDDRFVALAALEFNFNSQEIFAFNAGLPSLLFESQNGEIQEVKSSSMSLGIFEPDQFSISPVVFDMNDVGQIAVFSDGLIEQQNSEGDALHLDGIIDLVGHLSRSKKQWSQIETTFTKHLGDQDREDDITLCVIDTQTLLKNYQAPEKNVTELAGELALSVSASGDFLRVLDLIKLVTNVVTESRIESRFANQVFTVLAELYNNALDHGVLSLDSALKNDVMGFAEFLSQREEALARLSVDDQIKLSVKMQGAEHIEVDVADSGPGFDHRATVDSNGLSGRGLALLKQLANHIERNQAGNQVKAVMKKQDNL